jgi:protoporphyrinogen oxidase
MSMKWAIVGGGMLGLSLAEQATSLGADVTLYEAADHLGGLAAPWRLGGVVWDRHYHVTLASDAYLRALLRRLDLETKVVWKKTRTGAFVGGRLYPASNGLEFLKLPGLNVLDKARVVATMLAGSRTPKDVLENQTAEAWLRRWSGDDGYQRFWEPLLRSKLGDAHRCASASFIGATIERLSSARRNEFGEERFGYVPGGYAVVVDRYVQRLKNLGVRIRTSAPVRSIRRKGSCLEITSNHGVHEADRVVVTAPAPVSALICPDLSEEERGLMSGLRYQGIVCAALLCSRRLSPYYVTNLIDSGLPFTGVIEMTALVDPNTFGGDALIYLPKYAAPDDPIFKEDDASVERSFVAGLRLIHPSLRDEDIRAFRVSRVRQVFTIPTIGYSRNLPPMRTSVEELYVVNGAHIVGGTLNVNETLALSERAFALLMEGGGHATTICEPVAGSR